MILAITIHIHVCHTSISPQLTLENIKTWTGYMNTLWARGLLTERDYNRFREYLLYCCLVILYNSRYSYSMFFYLLWTTKG